MYYVHDDYKIDFDAYFWIGASSSVEIGENFSHYSKLDEIPHGSLLFRNY